MVIDQRNAGASVTLANDTATYTLDRWYAQENTAAVIAIQQSTTVPTGFKNSLLWTVSSTGSVSAGSYNIIVQPIEGFNVADLGFGASGASTITISFWVRCSVAATYGGAIRNSAQNRSYSFAFTINSANTWEQKTVTIAGDTSGTWLTNNGVGLDLVISLGSGSNFQSTANVWYAGNQHCPTGSASLVGTASATFYITGVQLEKGSTATSFDYRPYGTELSLCQRYVWVYSGNSYAYARGPVLNVSTTSTIWYMQYPTTMRAAPSLSLNNITSSTIEFSNYTTGTSPTYSSSVFNESSIWTGSISFVTTGTIFTTGSVGNWRWTGAPSANFTFSAEL